MIKWYSLFSHTGKETEAVKSLVGSYVELKRAVTTNMDYRGALHPVKLATGTEVNQWLMTPGNIEPGSVITLNGYMRILPTRVLQYLHSINCRVLNIHPAPISMYPELRGMDPQERLYEGIQEGKYGYIGTVIHEVDAGVDTGHIVNWAFELADRSMSKGTLYKHLHDQGTVLWAEVFEEMRAHG